MGTIRFVLRTDKPDKDCMYPVQMIYQIKGARKYYKTGQKLFMANWDVVNQNAIYANKTTVKKVQEAANETLMLSARDINDINLKLAAIKKDVVDAERRFEYNKVPYSTQMIIDAVKGASAPVTKKEANANELYEYIDKYTNVNRLKRKKSSLAVYTTLKNHIKDYQKHFKTKVTFEVLDANFFIRFEGFLLQEKKMNNVTVAKHLSTVKTFINYAKSEGVIVNEKYKNYKISRQNLEVITLNNDEFERLFYMDLSQSKRLEEIRDIFCFGCATGLRYSDLEQLDWKHIKRDEIKLTVMKTGQEIVIPLNPFSQTIINKYKNTPKPLPGHMVSGKYRMLSNQKLNNGLNGRNVYKNGKFDSRNPGLCELAGINEPVEIVRMRGVNRQSITYPKYELISMHVARKTFITLSLEKGMNAEEVMSLSGHQTYASFKRYVNITQQRKKAVMAKTWGALKQEDLKVV